MFKHLGERLERGPCDNTMRFATDFLLDSDECNDCDEAIEWLAERGGFCDCEVLLNVEPPSDRDAIQASTRAYERIIEAVDEYETAKKRMG